MQSKSYQIWLEKQMQQQQPQHQNSSNSRSFSMKMNKSNKKFKTSNATVLNQLLSRIGGKKMMLQLSTNNRYSMENLELSQFRQEPNMTNLSTNINKIISSNFLLLDKFKSYQFMERNQEKTQSEERKEQINKRSSYRDDDDQALLQQAKSLYSSAGSYSISAKSPSSFYSYPEPVSSYNTRKDSFIETKPQYESKTFERFTEKPITVTPLFEKKIEQKIEKKEDNTFGLLKRIETNFDSIGFTQKEKKEENSYSYSYPKQQQEINLFSPVYTPKVSLVQDYVPYVPQESTKLQIEKEIRQLREQLFKKNNEGIEFVQVSNNQEISADSQIALFTKKLEEAKPSLFLTKEEKVKKEQQFENSRDKLLSEVINYKDQDKIIVNNKPIQTNIYQEIEQLEEQTKELQDSVDEMEHKVQTEHQKQSSNFLKQAINQKDNPAIEQPKQSINYSEVLQESLKQQKQEEESQQKKVIELKEKKMQLEEKKEELSQENQPDNQEVVEIEEELVTTEENLDKREQEHQEIENKINEMEKLLEYIHPSDPQLKQEEKEEKKSVEDQLIKKHSLDQINLLEKIAQQVNQKSTGVDEKTMQKIMERKMEYEKKQKVEQSALVEKEQTEQKSKDNFFSKLKTSLNSLFGGKSHQNNNELNQKDEEPSSYTGQQVEQTEQQVEQVNFGEQEFPVEKVQEEITEKTKNEEIKEEKVVEEEQKTEETKENQISEEVNQEPVQMSPAIPDIEANQTSNQQDEQQTTDSDSAFDELEDTLFSKFFNENEETQKEENNNSSTTEESVLQNDLAQEILNESLKANETFNLLFKEHIIEQNDTQYKLQENNNESENNNTNKENQTIEQEKVEEQIVEQNSIDNSVNEDDEDDDQWIEQKFSKFFTQENESNKKQENTQTSDDITVKQEQQDNNTETPQENTKIEIGEDSQKQILIELLNDKQFNELDFLNEFDEEEIDNSQKNEDQYSGLNQNSATIIDLNTQSIQDISLSKKHGKKSSSSSSSSSNNVNNNNANLQTVEKKLKKHKKSLHKSSKHSGQQFILMAELDSQDQQQDFKEQYDQQQEEQQEESSLSYIQSMIQEQLNDNDDTFNDQSSIDSPSFSRQFLQKTDESLKLSLQFLSTDQCHRESILPATISLDFTDFIITHTNIPKELYFLRHQESNEVLSADTLKFTSNAELKDVFSIKESDLSLQQQKLHSLILSSPITKEILSLQQTILHTYQLSYSPSQIQDSLSIFTLTQSELKQNQEINEQIIIVNNDNNSFLVREEQSETAVFTQFLEKKSENQKMPTQAIWMLHELQSVLCSNLYSSVMIKPKFQQKFWDEQYFYIYNPAFNAYLTADLVLSEEVSQSDDIFEVQFDTTQTSISVISKKYHLPIQMNQNTNEIIINPLSYALKSRDAPANQYSKFILLSLETRSTDFYIFVNSVSQRIISVEQIDSFTSLTKDDAPIVFQLWELIPVSQLQQQEQQ